MQGYYQPANIITRQLRIIQHEMKGIKRFFPIVSALTLLTGFSACGSKGDQQQAAQGQQAPAVKVMTVSKGSSESELSYPATIKGKTDIAIRPQVTGFITRVWVDEGQSVAKGQLLFSLDQVTFQAAVEQAQANVNAARTQLDNARLTADSKRRLYDKNIISELEWQMADNTLRSAQASLAQAQAALAQARKNLSYCSVTAPSSGVVGSIPNKEGSLASPSSMEPLTTVSDISQVYAYFSLTEKDLLQMTGNGSRSLASAIADMPPVELRLSDGSLYPERGKVATVSGVIDQATGAASVRALFSNPSGVLRSGLSGNIIIPKDQSDVIVIPQRATYELQDRRFVYVVNDSNKVVSTPITVQANSDGQTFVVTSGLTPGQRIVIEGVGTVVKADGQAITPVAIKPEDLKAQAAAQQQATPAK